jgi:hypothetical protein
VLEPKRIAVGEYSVAENAFKHVPMLHGVEVRGRTNVHGDTQENDLFVLDGVKWRVSKPKSNEMVLIYAGKDDA